MGSYVAGEGGQVVTSYPPHPIPSVGIRSVCLVVLREDADHRRKQNQTKPPAVSSIDPRFSPTQPVSQSHK
jgi:hypothetical protein